MTLINLFGREEIYIERIYDQQVIPQTRRNTTDKWEYATQKQYIIEYFNLSIHKDKSS